MITKKMLRFSPGDRVRNPKNGNTGTIESVRWNAIHNEDEYVIRWDNMAMMTYLAVDVDSVWEYIPPTLPAPGQQMQVFINGQHIPHVDDAKYTVDRFAELKQATSKFPSFPGSDHNCIPINVGFNIPKMVCKHCNKDLPNE